MAYIVGVQYNFLSKLIAFNFTLEGLWCGREFYNFWVNQGIFEGFSCGKGIIKQSTGNRDFKETSITEGPVTEVFKKRLEDLKDSATPLPFALLNCELLKANDSIPSPVHPQSPAGAGTVPGTQWIHHKWMNVWMNEQTSYVMACVGFSCRYCFVCLNVFCWRDIYSSRSIIPHFPFQNPIFFSWAFLPLLM